MGCFWRVGCHLGIDGHSRFQVAKTLDRLSGVAGFWHFRWPVAGIDDDLLVACYWRSNVSGALEPHSSDRNISCNSQSHALSASAHPHCYTDQPVATLIWSRDLWFHEVVSVTTASSFRRSVTILRRRPDPCDSYARVASARQVFDNAWIHASRHRGIWVGE